jgi:hypothetical protein
MARGHHPGQPGRGPGHRRQPGRRPLGRPARHRPARGSPGEDRHAGEDRRSPPSTRRTSPASGDAAPDPRFARAGRRPHDRGRPVDRHPARTGSPVVGASRPGRGRAADRGARRPQPPRPAGASGDPADPLRRGRRAGCVSRRRRSPARCARPARGAERVCSQRKYRCDQGACSQRKYRCATRRDGAGTGGHCKERDLACRYPVHPCRFLPGRKGIGRG